MCTLNIDNCSLFVNILYIIQILLKSNSNNISSFYQDLSLDSALKHLKMKNFIPLATKQKFQLPWDKQRLKVILYLFDPYN